jgi:hypothetical protein
MARLKNYCQTVTSWNNKVVPATLLYLFERLLGSNGRFYFGSIQDRDCGGLSSEKSSEVVGRLE